MLARAAAAEILARYDEVAGLHAANEIIFGVFHAVLRQFYRIGGIQIPRWNDDIGINVVAVFQHVSA